MHRQDGRRSDNEDAHDRRRRGNPLDFTITAGNVHDSKETLSLIQILEAKYLPKAGKHDVEECGQRYFLGDKGYISSIIERIPAAKGWISARPSRKNSKNPRLSTSALTKSGARSKTILNGSREREASQPETPKLFRCLLPL